MKECTKGFDGFVYFFLGILELLAIPHLSAPNFSLKHIICSFFFSQATTTAEDIIYTMKDTKTHSKSSKGSNNAMSSTKQSKNSAQKSSTCPRCPHDLDKDHELRICRTCRDEYLHCIQSCPHTGCPVCRLYS